MFFLNVTVDVTFKMNKNDVTKTRLSFSRTSIEAVPTDTMNMAGEESDVFDLPSADFQA